MLRLGGRVVPVLAGGALGAALIYVVVSRSYVPEQPWIVDPDSPAVASPGTGPRALRLAVTPVWSPERTIDSYVDLADQIASQLARPIAIVKRKTYGEVLELLRHGSVDFGIVCTGAILSGRRAGVDLEVLAVPTYAEGPTYRSLTIVRADAGFEDLEDLRGRSFGYTDPLSLTGHYYTLSRVIALGEDPATWFSRTLFTYSHDGSIHAVLDGIVDGAAVDNLIYDFELGRNPRLAAELRVIHRSPPLGVSPVVARRSLEPEVRDAIRRALLSMSAAPAGRAVMAALGAGPLREAPAGLYEEAERIFETVVPYLGAENR